MSANHPWFGMDIRLIKMDSAKIASVKHRGAKNRECHATGFMLEPPSPTDLA